VSRPFWEFYYSLNLFKAVWQSPPFFNAIRWVAYLSGWWDSNSLSRYPFCYILFHRNEHDPDRYYTMWCVFIQRSLNQKQSVSQGQTFQWTDLLRTEMDAKWPTQTGLEISNWFHGNRCFTYMQTQVWVDFSRNWHSLMPSRIILQKSDKIQGMHLQISTGWTNTNYLIMRIIEIIQPINLVNVEKSGVFQYLSHSNHSIFFVSYFPCVWLFFGDEL
jgi:hypothetical protein